MSDPIRVVEEIRAFLQANDQSFKDRLTELATEYQAACAEVNQRLSRCAQLLRQGLRGEAIHLAEAEPNLLELLTSLDFPERLAWLDLVNIYTLPSPPDLDLATADQLNVAYAEHDPLKNLLKKHRRLALARSHLRERIGVLRELARVDPTNPIWGEDQQTYEQARFKQIQAEAAEAARQHDLAAAAALDEELSRTEWAARPSPALVDGVRKMFTSFQQQEARKQLPARENELNDAFAALDIAAGRKARAHWQAGVAEAGLSRKDPWHERVEPALLWLQREERKEAESREYDIAVERLADALRDSTPLDQLAELRRAVARFEGGVPESLEARYQSLLAAFARSVRQRKMLLLGAVAAAGLVFVVLSFAIYLALNRNESRRRDARILTDAVDGKRIDDIEKLIDDYGKNRPDVLQTEAVLAVMPEVDRLRSLEKKRAQDFNERIEESEENPLAEETPKALAEAKKLARTSMERKRLATCARQIEQSKRDEIARQNQETAPRLDELESQLDRLEGDVRSATRKPADLLNEAGTLSGRLSRIAPANGLVSEDVRVRARPLSERIEKVKTTLHQRQQRIDAELRMTAAVGNVKQDTRAYIEASQGLASVIADTDRANELKRALEGDDRACWEAPFAWSRVVEQWPAETTPLSPEAARKRVAECQQFLKENPRYPDAPAIAEYIKYLEPITLRDKFDDGYRARLVKFLSESLLDPIYVIKYRRKYPIDHVARYYTPAVPPLKGPYRIDHRYDFTGKTKRAALDEMLVFQPGGPSPQTIKARAIKVALRDSGNLAKWDETLLRFAREINDDPEIDPVCKLFMLRGILGVATDGSAALRGPLEPVQKELERIKELERVCWMDPDVDADKPRKEAAGVLAKLQGWENLMATAKTSNAQFLKTVTELPRPVGWLRHDGSEWYFEFSTPLGNTEEGSLVVAVPEGPRGTWKSVGKLPATNGKPVPSDSGAMALGRLVFLRRPLPRESAGERAHGQ